MEDHELIAELRASSKRVEKIMGKVNLSLYLSDEEWGKNWEASNKLAYFSLWLLATARLLEIYQDAPHKEKDNG